MVAIAISNRVLAGTKDPSPSWGLFDSPGQEVPIPFNPKINSHNKNADVLYHK